MNYEEYTATATDTFCGTLLYLHGFCGSYHDNMSEGELGKYFDYYAINMPGHGSQKIERFDSSLDEYAQYAAQYIEQKNLTDLTLVGHSLGGAVALLTEAKVRSRLKCLVLLDPVTQAILETPGLKELLFPRTMPELFSLCEHAYKHFDQIKQLPGYVEDCEKSLTFQLERWDYMEGLYEEMVSPMAMAQVQRALETIQTKTLYLMGKYDGLIPYEAAVRNIPPNRNIRLCTFEDSAHCPQNEQIDLFVSELRAFTHCVHAATMVYSRK